MDLFQRWRIDIVELLSTTEDENYYIIIVVDYFSRWPKARVIRQTNATTVATFVYKEIVCRFGLPKVI